MPEVPGYQTPHNKYVRELIGGEWYTGNYYRIERGPNYIGRWDTARNSTADLTDYPTEQPDVTLPTPIEVVPGLFFEEECVDVPCDQFGWDDVACEIECAED